MGARVAAAYLLFQLGPVVMTLERMGGSRHTENPLAVPPPHYFLTLIFIYLVRGSHTTRRIFSAPAPVHIFIFIFVGVDAFCGAVPRALMRVCM